MRYRMGMFYRFPFLLVLAKNIRGGWWTNRRLRQLIGERKIVLDLGCGVGALAKVLHPSCAYTGIEYNRLLAERGRSRGRNILVGDVRSLSYPSADVVVLYDLLHHLSDKDARRVLQRARRAKEKVILVEPSFLGWTKIPCFGKAVDWAFVFFDADGVVPRPQPRSLEDTRELLTSLYARFEVHEERSFLSGLFVIRTR